MHVLRAVLFSWVTLVAFFTSPVRLQATNQTVSATDERISYLGEWTEVDGGGHVFTSIAGSFSLNFNGSAIYWYSRKLYDGAIAKITLDGEEAATVDLSEGMTQTSAIFVAALYSSQGLDANSSHNVNVSWAGPGATGSGSFLENYYFM